MPARVLFVAVLAAGLGAQGPSLVYDNGPFQTSPGFSNLDTSTGHTVPGYGGQLTTTVDIALFDEFVVSTTMVVEEVEFFCYQTGVGSAASTITSAYIAFYDTDPSLGGAPMAGSPVPTVDMFTTPNNPVSNAWTGVYRELNGNHATNRAIMGVAVKLEDAAGTATPLVLPSGIYWLRIQAAGSATSGPWFVPITCAGQGVTGNAMQFIAATLVWENPIQSGSAGAQGLPFKLFGQLATAGQIVQTAVGCGATGISVCGAPNLGGFVRTELTLTSSSTISVIGYGFAAAPQSVCGCNFIHNFPITVWLTTVSVIDIPLDPAFGGLNLGIQAVEFGATGGCAQYGALTVTDGYEARVNM